MIIPPSPPFRKVGTTRSRGGLGGIWILEFCNLVIGDYLMIGAWSLDILRLDDLPLPLLHILRHISSIDDQGCMPHHPGVIDLTVVCNDHDGIEPLK